jgi:alpha-tubulin suppressor-like RCC1 family protein
LGRDYVPVEAQSGVVAIAGGNIHTLALKANGSVIAWGSNNYGQTTVPVAAQSGVVAIAAGYEDALALKRDGSVVAWGRTKAPAGLPPAFAISPYAALVRDPPPSLTLLRNADQTLSLSWTGAGTLEQTESLSAPNWQPPLSQSNPQMVTTVAGRTQFYRLRSE